ncbi:hypothetical protein D3875_07900 [Deinococcus cavernae]|uniref:Phage antirepressor Ant n=1 Tax=Deinococcus cavernae TaxID=2320857 RepID=A0A418V5W2_9DEIO|nr:antA/AntB antirepressor family protein [Deinococcus cavernae]RJF71503.1 hypothetical protein D3875_07900 [Deinococcus cavernae]
MSLEVMLPIEDRSGQLWVNARMLHTALEVGRDFSNWIRSRLEEVDAVEGEDFSPILAESTGGRPAREYLLSLDTAKEVAMMERNEIGKQIRRYFIEAEKKLRERPALDMSDPLVLAQQFIAAETERRKLAEENKTLENKIVEDAPKVLAWEQAKNLSGHFGLSEGMKILSLAPKIAIAEMRGDGYLMDNNLPYQKYIEQGLFVVKEVDDGRGFARRQARITPKGIGVIGERYCNRPHLSQNPKIRKQRLQPTTAIQASA